MNELDELFARQWPGCPSARRRSAFGRRVDGHCDRVRGREVPSLGARRAHRRAASPLSCRVSEPKMPTVCGVSGTNTVARGGGAKPESVDRRSLLIGVFSAKMPSELGQYEC